MARATLLLALLLQSTAALLASEIPRASTIYDQTGGSLATAESDATVAARAAGRRLQQENRKVLRIVLPIAIGLLVVVCCCCYCKKRRKCCFERPGAAGRSERPSV